MDYLIMLGLASLDVALVYGLYAQGKEIDWLKNELRRFEMLNARQTRETHVYHHGKPQPIGQGKGALVRTDMNA